MRRPWLGPAILATLLFLGSISAYGQSNQPPIAQWDIETRNGITGEMSGNGSITVMGDIVIVGFSVSQENMEDDDRWELWMKHDGIWTLLQNGEISDGENLEKTDVGIPINSTGLFEIHLRLFPSSRTDSIDFYADPNPLDLVPAGQLGVAIQGEPLHEGDSLTLSALVHNRGDRTVSPLLELVSGGVESKGSPVVIKPGSSKELETSINVANTGSITVYWAVIGDGIGVSHLLSDSIEVTVLPTQTLEITSVIHDAELDSLEVSVLLSEGRDRELRISATPSISGGFNSQSPQVIASMMPGLQSFSLPVPGDYSGEMEVYAEPIGWSGEKASEKIILEPLFSDANLIGEFTPHGTESPFQEISYTIRNTGSSILNNGIIEAIWVVDGRVISTKQIPEIYPSDEYSSKISFSQSLGGTPGEIQLVYKSNLGTYTTTVQYVPESDDNGGFEFPFQLQAAIIGSVMGVVVLLLTILVMRTFNTEVTTTNFGGEGTKNPKDLTTKCSNCGLQLYHSKFEQNVRCPACSTMNTPGRRKRTDPLNSKEISAVQETEMTASSSNDIISCPQCSQALKVPMSRRPVMARCPACKCTFEATVEESA